MTAGCSHTVDWESSWTSLISADVSREQGLLGSSEDDSESRCERLTPMMCVEMLWLYECYERGQYLVSLSCSVFAR